MRLTFDGCHSLTGRGASVCIRRVKRLLVLGLLFAASSCTTLENRRDLYRSPEEGYERNFRHPPPTRRPASGPLPAATSTGVPVPVERHGVITFPEEPLPDGGG